MSNIRIKTNYSLIIFLIVMLYLSKLTEICVIIGTIIIHELSHIICAYIFGYRGFKIELSMFGGMCYMNIDTRRKVSSCIIYLSGIIINLVLIVLSIILIKKKVCSEEVDYVLNVIKHYNIIMVLFSVLPIYPLDGYRVINLYIKNSYKVSYAFIVLLFITNVYFQSIGLLILSIFLLYKNRRVKDEELNLKLRTIYEDLINK